jgi:hypothetical protein
MRAKRVVAYLSNAPRFASRNCGARSPRQAEIARYGTPENSPATCSMPHTQ